ncbi:MAG TPA: DUF3179 domain-containing protein [Paracoccaceae bacterium]|nr:DUF3179 domain-containing protein [Paracoccaceae bacterium]
MRQRPALIVALLTAVQIALASPATAQDNRFRADWPATDFGRSAVPLDEVLSGGPPKDGIPAVDDPRAIPVARESRLAEAEPVLSLTLGGETRAWPIRYLMWHEIANDRLGGVPVAVTFCPLCNTGMVFDRRHAGAVLDFGVSGLLRHSDMIMYDRQTESWWQQATGEGIVGRHMGARLRQLPAVMESWGEFRARHPDATVMDEPGAARSYGRNPYAGYDSSARPFLYRGEDPPHGIHPLARVVRAGNRAWPLERVRRAGRIEEAGLVLTWTPGQVSALDTATIARGREVGTVRVTDAAGRPAVHDIPFAFAFHAFHPQGEWMLGR